MIHPLTGAAIILSLVASTAASATEVKVHASGAIAVVLDTIRDDYRQRTGDTLNITIDRSVDIGRAIAAGENSDVVIAEAATIDRLMASGRGAPGSLVHIASSPICVVVPAGRHLPAIDTPRALRRALLAAPTVGYSNSLSGHYVTTTMFPRLGIASQMRRTARQVPVATATAAGSVAIAFSQCSEMLHVSGLTVVGPLPEALQHRSTLSGFIGVHAPQMEAGGRLLRYLASSAADVALRDSGLTPIRRSGAGRN